MTYIFFLGNSPDLAYAELSSVWSHFQTTPSQQPVQEALLHTASVQSDFDRDQILTLANRLGGTVKVAEVFAQIDNADNISSEIVSELEKFAKKNNLNKISFGISQFRNAADLSKKVKLKINPHFKVRFVLPNLPSQELSTVVIKKQQLIEISILKTGNSLQLLRTIWVQDFEDWGKRDYGRPEAQSHIGMLPPKVARMMVNLALPGIILDPFCGVGTIPAEGLILGANVIASDLDKNQVQRTKENLKWLESAYDIRNTKYEILNCDAPNVAKVLKQKVNAIVTEPDLGKVSQDFGNLVGLYLACLKNWKEILKPGGKIIIAVPSYSVTGNISKDNNQYLVKTVLDKAKIMGYSLSQGPFVYARPQAKVIRNIIALKYGPY